jgi:membrane-anchored glycerophosphoryl diester phosphodiesterase (GDPDase)
MWIFVIIIFFLLTGLVFALVLLLTKIIRTGSKKHVGTIESRKKQKLFTFITSVLIAGLTTYFFLFPSLASNYKTAYIESEKQGFKVTVKGKRLYMVHDPISILRRKTYEDSMQYLIPRSVGVIKGEELPREKGYYKFVGTIAIRNDKMEINLAVDNYDDKKLDPDTWNGKYKLVWRKH